jgi:hypothetical protein
MKFRCGKQIALVNSGMLHSVLKSVSGNVDENDFYFTECACIHADSKL